MKVLPTYQEFVSQLEGTYPSYFCGEKKFVIKYLDNDGDKIAVTSQIEFEEMISQLSGESSLKFFVEFEEVKQPPKKNEENINIVCPEEEKSFLENVEDMVKEIPVITDNLFQECSNQWQKRRNLYWNLHRMSLQYLDSLDKNVIQKGKEILLKMVDMFPNNKITLYNLACAESLLGNVKESISTLEKAIEAGYHDLTHMLNDKDFNNIKYTEGFNLLVQKLQRIINGDSVKLETEDVKIEEKVEEIKVEEKVEEIKVEEKVEDPLIEKLDYLGEIFP
jgi:tetratricopeptide (TPR) repeat protein